VFQTLAQPMQKMTRPSLKTTHTFVRRQMPQLLNSDQRRKLVSMLLESEETKPDEMKGIDLGNGSPWYEGMRFRITEGCNIDKHVGWEGFLV